MLYKEMLEHPNWQKKRLEILVRDNYTCAMCGDTETQLQIHHKSYNKGKKPWEYPLANLITLCKHCHIIVTDHQKGELILEVLAIRKEKSKNGDMWFLQVLTVHEINKYSICLYRIDQSGELEFRELIPNGQFQNTIDLINHSKNPIKNG